MWEKFDNIFVTVKDLILYEGAFWRFYTRLLQELYNDGIMYAEIRIGLSPVGYLPTLRLQS